MNKMNSGHKFGAQFRLVQRASFRENFSAIQLLSDDQVASPQESEGVNREPRRPSFRGQ